ncbi:MAG TPA: PucR family transcriptional regulator ligand-binding domain-containing protein [Streptosporangiaceae bacterium]|nr:PucR family transcriptional regulator ligand-binding domain-containing protein [Streptosporangiaceae bacterium]
MTAPATLPTVADVLALEPVRRGAPRVLTGADRLEAPVRWVHVIELAEAGHLLRGGELVLSTGIALPPDPDGLARFVAGLAAAGVSALAVELGSRYVRALPRPLVAAASATGLPLIAFERETQFIAITEAVHARILDAQFAELRAAQRLHETFTDLALAGASQDEIVSRAADVAGYPVILADLAHRVLACASAGQDTATVLAGFAARSRAVTVPGRIGYDAAAGWLIARVGSAQGDWGRIVFVLPAAPDAGLPVLAERAATTLTLARLTRRGPAENPQRAAHRSVLAALAGRDYADPADLTARVIALGMPLVGRQLVPLVVAAGNCANPDDLADVIAAATTDLRIPAIAGNLDGRAAALLALPPGVDPGPELTRLAVRLRHSAAFGPIPSIGVGDTCADVAELRSAFRDAANAAGAAACAPAGSAASALPLARLADLGLTGLAYLLRDEPRVVAFAERELGPLLLHDDRHGTGLMAVLEAYLETGGNKAETAKRCGIARPTLYERLSQITQVLGVSIDDAARRTTLHAALLVRQLGSG